MCLAVRVIRYTKPQKAEVLESFRAFKARATMKKHTLFVVIADECHWGAIKDKAHDTYINDPELLNLSNVVTLPVSATPYCLLTLDSRLPEWYTAEA